VVAVSLALHCQNQICICNTAKFVRSALQPRHEPSWHEHYIPSCLVTHSFILVGIAEVRSKSVTAIIFIYLSTSTFLVVNLFSLLHTDRQWTFHRSFHFIHFSYIYIYTVYVSLPLCSPTCIVRSTRPTIPLQCIQYLGVSFISIPFFIHLFILIVLFFTLKSLPVPPYSDTFVCKRRTLTYPNR
jgi:hypothetical protein